MELSPGTSFGSYQIQGPLGAGGMGEVYRALDTELRRVVAIKVLPERFLADGERVARFEQEATTLAAINHPHVAQIYGLAHGPNSTRLLVMEFVEGDDLSARLPGGLPIDEALAIARQVAAALQAAHEIGIIHRDLKPANIKVRPDGVVKVLDFGLARMVEHPALSELQPGVPTMSAAAITEQGVILGTIPYMSPEQAKGLTVDRRSDIWSFGCVLFEMLTGRRAFAGSTRAEALGAILHTTPDWSLLPAGTPSSIRALLRRCLARDRAPRLDSAAVARIEIEEASNDSEQAPQASGNRARSWMWAVLGGAAVAAAVAAATLGPLERSVEPATELRVDIATPLSTDPYSFAVSPDGRKIVYVGAGASGPLQLWVRAFDRDAPVVVPNTESAVNPLWSPDSASIAFFANGKLRRVDLNAGEATTLADAPAGRGGSWSNQSQILFTQNASGPISMVAASGSQLRTVTTLAAGDGGHLAPVWHPDGRRFLFFVQSGDPERRGTYLAALDSPNRTRVVAADGTADFRGANEIVYVDEGTLYSQRFDPASNAVSGERVRIATGISTPIGRSAFSLSRSGPIAYRSGRSLGAQLRWLGRNGEDLGAFADPDAEYASGVELSPSGDRVALTRRASGNIDIWIVEGAGRARTRLTSNPAQEVFPVWTPDGRAIAFRSSRGSTADIYMARTDGDGDGTRIIAASTVGASQVSATDISRDGRWLLFYSTATTGRDIWAYSIDRPGEKPRRVTDGPADESNGVFSRDGRWIAYQTNESGRFEIAVRAFANTDRMWQVSNGGGLHPRWSQDGKELYYVAPSGRVMAVAVSVSDTAFQSGPAVALFAPRFSQAFGANPFAALYNVDRGRFLVSTAAHDLAAAPITLLFNWSGK